MQFSEYQLRQWVNPELSTEALAHVLTMSGLEVEAIEPVAPMFTSVLVAQVLAIEPHPNADRLRVVTVNVGQDQPLQIVCGAANVVLDAKVPCAIDGAMLPHDFRIKPTTMRGVASAGMLCSAKELGLEDAVDGLLILPHDAPVGMPLRDYLDLDDQLITLKITPNRADALSLKGIAREVAALTNTPLYDATASHRHGRVQPSFEAPVSVHIAAPEACGRYVGRMIRGVNAAVATPDFMKQTLLRSGLRPVSFVVDVTNYVLITLGQPMHAFDADLMGSAVTIRLAQAGEALHCLNDKTVTLHEQSLVIADDQQVLALAGFMGGMAASVTEQTQTIVLESAYFAPEAIAGQSRIYGFGSDASFRFERGVDWALQHDAMSLATDLIVTFAGGSVSTCVEAKGHMPERPQTQVRVARVNQLLGTDLSADTMASIFQSLHVGFVRTDLGFELTAPTWRFDLAIEEDYIEEIARVLGYDHIPLRPIHSSIRMLPLPSSIRTKSAIRAVMVGRDYQEVVNYAFVDERWEQDFAANLEPVRLQNPLAAQYSVMRSTLIGGLIQTLQTNLARQAPRVRVFEVARVFHGEGVADQPERLAALAYGLRSPEQWSLAADKVDFYDVKADVEALCAPQKLNFTPANQPAYHPGRCAAITLDDGSLVGYVGELHPSHVRAYDFPAAPVMFELDYAVLAQQSQAAIVQPSKYQASRRDLALVVDEAVSAQALIQACQSAANAWVTAIDLFDVYRGAGVPQGQKSMALSISLQKADASLTEAEIESTVAALLLAAQTQCGASLR